MLSRGGVWGHSEHTNRRCNQGSDGTASKDARHRGGVIPMAGETSFPIIIAEWDRNGREVVRVSLDCYRGQHTIDIRVWWFSGRDLKPGKTGIRSLGDLADGLSKARERAAELGLVDRS
jgi:hypothetical protein